MRGGRLKNVKEWEQSVLEALAIVLLLFVFLWPVKVEGVSMQPSVNDGDRVIISRFAARAGLYDRGDIIVFDDDDYEKNMIKRVIAMGGDTVSIEDGSVFLNGNLLDETYIKKASGSDMHVEVPDGMVFVMGDNREDSVDSRTFGPVSKKSVYGKVLFKFYPLNEMKVL